MRHLVNRSKDSHSYKSLHTLNDLLLSPTMIMIDLIPLSFLLMLLIKEAIEVKLTIVPMIILFTAIYIVFGCMYWLLALLFHFKH